MRRITATEYSQSIEAVLEVAPTGALPVDVEVLGFSRVGAGTTSINALGAEQYETLANEVARRAFSDSARARRLSGCTPTGESDATCARTAITSLGARLFRRPLTEAEISLYATLATNAATHVASFDGGLALAVSAMLQSPRFLNQVEVGEAMPGSDSRRRYTSYEMAARLASFLWSSLPDSMLNEAAARGDLLTDDGLRTQVTRMLADPRARTAIVDILEEHLDLKNLELAVPNSGETAGLASAMREEVRRVLEAVTFDEPSTRYRDLFTRDTTFVNGLLAAHYGLSAPTGTAFQSVTLPANRRGLLSLGAVLASHGHGGRTSPTLRGLFVRQRLLCGVVGSPPPGVGTELPMSSGATARERLALHVANESCAGCHLAMDPIGLSFEQFDSIAAFRTQENGANIDPSGDLDGAEFADAVSLGAAMASHPALDACLAKNLFRAATGRREAVSEESTFDFAMLPSGDLSIQDLISYVVLSQAFRTFQPQS